jgi:hypothetical protein
MDDQHPHSREPAEPPASQTGESSPETGASTSKPTKALTPEEQMALYEEDLKENDWGHQPC